MDNLSSSLHQATARQPGSLGRSSYIEVEPNVRLHVTDLGQGYPVVLLHGWPLSGAMYEYQFPALLAAGCRVISITMRGFGQSDKPFGDYGFNVHADDIKAVLEALGVENATLGGHSMGGAVAIRYMSRHAGAHVSKLALFAATAPVAVRRPDYPYCPHTMEETQGLIHLFYLNRPQALEEYGKTYTDVLPPSIAAWLLHINLQAMPYATVQTLLAACEADLRPELASIQGPVVIFHGRQDRVHPFAYAEQLQLGLPNATIIPFEHSGHALFYEELAKFNAELIRFITLPA